MLFLDFLPLQTEIDLILTNEWVCVMHSADIGASVANGGAAGVHEYQRPISASATRAPLALLFSMEHFHRQTPDYMHAVGVRTCLAPLSAALQLLCFYDEKKVQSKYLTHNESETFALLHSEMMRVEVPPPVRQWFRKLSEVSQGLAVPRDLHLFTSLDEHDLEFRFGLAWSLMPTVDQLLASKAPHKHCAALLVHWCGAVKPSHRCDLVIELLTLMLRLATQAYPHTTTTTTAEEASAPAPATAAAPAANATAFLSSLSAITSSAPSAPAATAASASPATTVSSTSSSSDLAESVLSGIASLASKLPFVLPVVGDKPPHATFLLLIADVVAGGCPELRAMALEMLPKKISERSVNPQAMNITGGDPPPPRIVSNASEYLQYRRLHRDTRKSRFSEIAGALGKLFYSFPATLRPFLASVIDHLPSEPWTLPLLRATYSYLNAFTMSAM